MQYMQRGIHAVGGAISASDFRGIPATLKVIAMSAPATTSIRPPQAQVVTLETILEAVADTDAVLAEMRQGFIALTDGRVSVAPVVHMAPSGGECCIKVSS